MKQQPPCPHFSTPHPLVRLVRLHTSIWIHGCGVIGCHLKLMVFFCCSIASGQHGGGWRGLVLGTGWRRLLVASAAPSITPSCDALSKLRPWSKWTANSEKKLNVNKPCMTSRKTVFRFLKPFFFSYLDPFVI